MNNNQQKRNAEGMAPCKHCLKKHKKYNYPQIIVLDGLYFARCPECQEYDKYEFLALSRTKCINVWNKHMEGKGFNEF